MGISLPSKLALRVIKPGNYLNNSVNFVDEKINHKSRMFNKISTSLRVKKSPS